jgi:hypothetical protein
MHLLQSLKVWSPNSSFIAAFPRWYRDKYDSVMEGVQDDEVARLLQTLIGQNFVRCREMAQLTLTSDGNVNNPVLQPL